MRPERVRDNVLDILSNLGASRKGLIILTVPLLMLFTVIVVGAAIVVASAARFFLFPLGYALTTAVIAGVGIIWIAKGYREWMASFATGGWSDTGGQ
jgi:hypothetical protein